MADSAEQQSPLAGDEGEDDTPGSPEAEEELEEVNSPRSEGESDYEDAPSRLEESHIQNPDNDQSDLAQNSASPSRATSPRHVLSPGVGDETIYASASESFLSEAGAQDSGEKDNDSPSEVGSEENGDDTNDPLGLDDDGSLDGGDEKEEGEEEGEEGELDGDDDDNLNASAYQTEPVSSDDDLDCVQDNDTSNKKSSSDSPQINKTESKRTGGQMVQNGHSKTENDINHEDHVELDYEEDLDEGDKLRGESKLDEDDKDEAEDGAYTSGSEQEATKNGEEEEDCEEGEIVDDDNDFRHEPRRLCRFFSRGHCTWGIDCRFLHPGINDKGNYSLIEKPLGPPSMAGRLGPQPWHRPQDRPPEEEPEAEPEEEEEPPPPSPPREETAWERGLRHAKEMRKLAKKRKEQETNFEEKKMNLSLEDVENKENYRDPERVESRTPTRVYLKDPYYDNAYDSEEDYYNKEDSWQDGHYQNFEVRWTRGPEDYPSEDYRPQRGIKVEDYNEEQYNERERLREKPHFRDRRSPPPDYRFDRMRREEKRPDKYSENRFKEGPSQKKSSSKPDIIRRDTGPSKPTRGDEWHDPWQRTNKEAPKKRPVSGSRSRSRSRGRRRKRSISSSSSYSSRSRSSSYSSRSSYSSSSSYSSRSSSRSSSSRSRSPAQRRPPGNRGGPPGPAASGPAAAGMSRRAPPTHGRGISASTKSGGPSNRTAAHKSAPAPMQKAVARVPDVARVPSVPMTGRDVPGRGPPSKGSPMKPPSSGVDRKSHRPDPARPSPLGSKQGNESQRRPMSSRSGGPPVKPGAKPGMVDGRTSGEQGSRMPPGSDDRSRKPGRGIPSRMKRQAASSSSSSRSRSRSYSSSSSGSSRSSSSSSGTSSGSADSDNLYRGVGKPGRRNVSPSPLRRKVPVPADKLRKQTSQSSQDRPKPRAPNVNKGPPTDRRKMEMDRARERDRKSAPAPKQSPTKPLPQRDRKESDSRVRSMVSSSSGLAPAKQMAKDPLKVSGQKQSIKLTLSNKERPPDKGGSSNAAKKRPAAENDAPPNKKVARSPSKDIRTVTKGLPPKNPEKNISRSRADSAKSPPAAKKPAESPAKGAKAPAAAKGKKSMSSRREELLQQLKAVEDAIARKRAKMN